MHLNGLTDDLNDFLREPHGAPKLQDQVDGVERLDMARLDQYVINRSEYVYENDRMWHQISIADSIAS
jgi:hypothetical protein